MRTPSGQRERGQPWHQSDAESAAEQECESAE